MRALVAASVIAAASGLAAPAAAQGADPRVEWATAESPHFRIHYRAAHRAQAEAVARAAERVWPRVTQALQWEPARRTEIAIYSELDIANGFSTPLPFNLIGLYLTPPDEGQLLENSNWLDILLVHEFTHTVHLDKVRGAPRVLQAIFGRLLWFVPNLFEPGWVLEGLAVDAESDPAAGRGRLKSPLFEAWLRAERRRGFLSLAEINAGGRALPLAKEYLYGAYFFEFLRRRYGDDKPLALVERYSGNVVPRLHSAPWGATGKTMDELWAEFLADLDEQVKSRAAAIEQTPDVSGTRVLGPLFDIPAVAALPGAAASDGKPAVLAVVDDGLGAVRLERVGRDGSREPLARLNRGARVDVAADGRVLVAMPDLCDTWRLAYDLYRLEGRRLERLTRCASLRRAVHAGRDIVAVELDAGRTRIVRLAGGEPASRGVLHVPADGVEVIDIAAASDGRALWAVTRREADWRLLEFDLSRPEALPRERLRHDAPLHGLRHGSAGLELLAVHDGQQNAWRLTEAGARPLTHAHTAVVAHGGRADDGSLATVVVAPQGYELRWLDAAEPLAGGAPLALEGYAPARAAAPAPSIAAVSAAPAAAPAPEPALGPAAPYAAWRTLWPRSWFPLVIADRGLTAYGASTHGADALGWHQYIAHAEWETSQHELLGGFEYIYLGRHGLVLDRSLTARAWTGGSGDEKTTLYDRNLQAQWLSLFPIEPLHGLQRRVHLGVGAAFDRVQRVQVAGGSTARLRDERLLAATFDVDTRGTNWYADGANRGWRASLLYETHEPFAPDRGDNAPDLDGHVLRGDLNAFFGIGRGALALRWTEARAGGRTKPYQLGGATESANAIGFRLNSRELALRGYRGDERELVGQSARLASLEWRMPLVDIDRHGMVPPVGINRLAGTAFFDIGGAWSSGNGPDRYRKSIGLELRGEIKLLYALTLDLRAGIGYALDPVPGASRTRAFLTLGQVF